MPRVLVDPLTQKPSTQPDELVPQLMSQGWREYTPEEAAASEVAAAFDEQHSGVDDKIQATLIGGVQGLGVGLPGVIKRAIDPEGAKRWGDVTRANPEFAIPAEIIGGIAGAVGTAGVGAAARAGKSAGAVARAAAASPAGRVAALGERVARTAETAGAATKIGRAAAGAGLEGAIAVAGSKAGDLALSDDPLTVERIGSELKSAFLYGGVASAIPGAALKSLEVGLNASRRGIARQQALAAQAADIPEDLVGLDRRALKELEKGELDVIEAARVPERQAFADDVAKFRETSKKDQPWVAVSSGSKASKKAAKAAAAAAAEEAIIAKAASAGGTKDTRIIRGGAADAAEEAAVRAVVPPPGTKYPRWVRETEKVYLEADKYLDKILRNPKYLASKPEIVQKALQQQENALEIIMNRSEELRALHLADRSGRRALALEKVPGELEANRALQARLADISAPPASTRLSGIRNADLLASSPRPPKGLLAKVGGGLAFGVAAGAVAGIPGIGPIIAPFVGAGAADFVSNRLAGRMAAGVSGAAARTQRAVEAFTDVTKKAQRVVPVVASRVLAETRFSPEPERRARGRKPIEEQVQLAKGASNIEKAFSERSAEIASSTMPTPEGPKVRPGVRAQIAKRLQPIAVQAPLLADRLETLAVARIEFLAKKMPPSTQLGMTRILPAEMAMRAWARYVAAADDPALIEERLADGSVTPEDAEVMRELYPERMAEITRQIVAQIADLRKRLPMQRRIALSIFTGAPVDASMEAHIIDVLQAGYEQEAGTEGGTQAPKPEPAFASVQKSVPSPTPAQTRAGGMQS